MNTLEQLKEILSNLSPEDKTALASLFNGPKFAPVKQQDLSEKKYTQAGNIQLGPRDNTFEKSRDFSGDKKDSKIDKKLWSDNKPVERGQRSTKVLSHCYKCNKEEEVSSIFAVLKEDEKGIRRLEHICDNCITERK